MPYNTSSVFPPVGTPVFRIDRNWCIGDSLVYVNANFLNIDTRIDVLSTNVFSLSSQFKSLSGINTPTLNLRFNNLNDTLSGEVVNNSIGTIKLGGDILQTGKALLTSANLSALADVRILTPLNNETILWNSSLGRWENKPIIVGAGASIATGFYNEIQIVGSNDWRVVDGVITETKIASNAVTESKILSGSITDIKVATNAAISGTKIVPNFGSQNITVNGANRSITNTGNFALTLGTNNTERVRIDNTGNVGIGTTNPAVPLDVVAASNSIALQVRGRSSDGIGAITFNNNTGNAGGQVNYIQSVANSYLAFATNNTERMRIDASGNVGIGTTSPLGKVQIFHQGGNGQSGLSDYGLVTVSTGNTGQQSTLAAIFSGGDGFGNLNLGNIDGTGVNRFWHISKRLAASSHALQFYYYNGTNFNLHTTFLTGGNVGIGTQTPEATLEVRSTVPTSALHPNRAGIIVSGEGTNVGGRLGIRCSSDAETPILIAYRSRNTIAAPSAVQVNDTLFNITPISYDGTTWYSAGANILFTAAENWSSTNHGTDITFSTVESGPSQTLTEKVRIANNGNVGIGTTDPQGKLEVNGNTITKTIITNRITVLEEYSVFSSLW